MKKTIFVDTGAFYARYVKRDEYHSQALSLWKLVQEKRYSCLTSNFVLSELITLLGYRFGNAKALQAAREIYTSHVIQIIPITLDLELAGLEWMENFLDQKFSMTDATSFALMKEQRLEISFTFDSHFEVAGFQRLYAERGSS